MSSTYASRDRVVLVEALAFCLAIVIGHLFFWHIPNYPSNFDASSYLEIGEDIKRNGLFSKFYYSDLRTYAYPTLLAMLSRVAHSLGIPLPWMVFETQLTLFIVATLLLKRSIQRIAPDVAPWIFITVVVNPFVPAITPESLTESLSLSLILLAISYYVDSIIDGVTGRSAFVASLVLGVAVMVRPANLFAVIAWGIATFGILVAQRPVPTSLAAIALSVALGLALPMAPQYVNNVRNYGVHTPFVAASLERRQQVWGIANLKYATALPPVPTASIFYQNPFAAAGPVDRGRPLAWYAAHPGAGLATIALHTFNMLDQDLFFTYSRDLDPWYRIPVGIVNHALIGFALAGVLILVASARRGDVHRHAAVGAAAYIGAHVAVHGTAAVEMRFGLPLLLLAGPAAIPALRNLSAQRSRAACTLALIAISCYVGASLALSAWVRQQAPAIRAWEAAHTLARLTSLAATFWL